MRQFLPSLRRSFGLQLSLRAILVVVVSNLILLAGLGAAFLYGTAQNQKIEVVTVGHLLATALETPLLVGDYAEVADMIRDSVALDKIGYARVTLSLGTTIAEAGQQRAERWDLPRHEIEIRFGNQVLGTLLVQMGRSQLEATLPSALLALCLSLILSLGMAYALFSRFIGRTESRVRILKQATESFARGDFTARAVVEGEDELADFGRQFDRALREIAASQDELRRALLAAESASVAKSRFLTTMSHEIRTPMNGVLGMAQLLLAGPVSARETREYARIILHSGQTLLALLNDILDLSKIEAGKMTLNDGVVVPSEIVRETTLLFSQSAQAKGLFLKSEWSGDRRQSYRGDPYRLRQMLSNLINNAIKFTSQGEILVTASEIPGEGPGALLEFRVSDSGIGIAQGQQDKLFKPFSQVDDSLTRQSGGSGLGLSIVRHLAELMDGEVGVQSHPGKGSNFWFRVRLASCREPDAADAGPASLAGQDRNGLNAKLAGRVLVVEDNPTNQLVIRTMLERIGIEPLLAENGEVALARVKAEAGRIQAILMDIEMPVLDGYQTTQRLRAWERSQQRAALPIIALTADAFPEDRERCLAAGMNDHLPKPVHLDALVGTLRLWLKPAPERLERGGAA